MTSLLPGQQCTVWEDGGVRRVRLICRSSINPGNWLCQDIENGKQYSVAESRLQGLTEWGVTSHGDVILPDRGSPETEGKANHTDPPPAAN